LTAGLFFNVFGPRLSAVSKKSSPDVYEQPYPLLNIAAGKKFGQFSIKTDIKNIINPDVSKIYTYKGKDYYHTRHKNGRSYSVNIGYTLK
jgi:hypothetical protein